ncbi:hypothetical protein [Pseudomonas sp. NY15354]|uniref:hypothetical protein n=1 Tax=Pseudomonas sp. NY15354 TaxID=3400351 RepID=UPI003A85121A
MKSRIGTAIALAGALAGTEANADGNALLAQCQQVARVMDGAQVGPNTDMVGAGQCLGMVEGVRNTITLLNTALPQGYRICFPDKGITNGQAESPLVF